MFCSLWRNVGAEGKIVVGTATDCLTKATLVVFLARTPGRYGYPAMCYIEFMNQKYSILTAPQFHPLARRKVRRKCPPAFNHGKS